jgi:hypothetical protein
MARLYDIYDILHLNGKRKQIVCPLPQHVHHHRTPSFSIFYANTGRQKWVCHGNCQQSGDSIDLAGFLHIPGYDKKKGEHVQRALALLTGGTQINPPKPETTKAATLPNGLYRRYLPAGDAVANYAATRGLTRETLDKFSIGQDGHWMTMPAIHGEQLRGIKKRNTRPNADKRDRFMQVAGSIDGLFGYNFVDGTRQPVAIVKGEIPVMLLSQFGILAAAPTGGEGSYYKHEELVYPLAFAARRIVIGDNDQDPEVKEKMQLAAKRRAEIFRAGVFFPPDPYTGIDDFVLAKPAVAIPLIKSWLA